MNLARTWLSKWQRISAEKIYSRLICLIVNLYSEGLRTLVISQKLLDTDFYYEWSRKYTDAKADLNDREANVARCMEELEHDMELLGVTGVEDKLQDEVALTIESLRGAGIQIWMLTGDKVETATCIAMSAGFKSRH
jgi:phospholipid-translocating ATPase